MWSRCWRIGHGEFECEFVENSDDNQVKQYGDWLQATPRVGRGKFNLVAARTVYGFARNVSPGSGHTACRKDAGQLSIKKPRACKKLNLDSIDVDVSEDMEGFVGKRAWAM
ncbi:hypothetical protein PTKIN_Ptkin10aG0111200 [Pterospermum kingtungense]